MTWAHDYTDVAGTSTGGGETRTTQATVTYTAAWDWSQKTFALSQSSA